MAKKNKSRKARKQAKQNLQKMPAGQLRQKGEALLAGGNYREAINSLKLALQKAPDDTEAQRLLVRAYALRESQLRQKGMLKEAEALHHQVRQHRPDVAVMEAADLPFFLGSTDLQNAISLYNAYLAHHPPVGEAETIIAGTLLETDDWQAATQMADSALLKPDLPVLREAARLMDSADWEAALDCLKPVTRRSPLAPVKLLCRAMVCFYQEDDDGMQRALAMIPDRFPLHPLAERLKTAPDRLPPLWQGQSITTEQIHFLLQTFKDTQASGTARIIRRMAQAIRPQDPLPAIEQLLCMLFPLATGPYLDAYDFANLAETLLPDPRGGAIAAKFDFLAFDDYFADTDTYIDRLDVEFPDPADRAVATSMVLSASVEWVVDQGTQFEAVHTSRFAKGALKRLGATSNEPALALLEIVLRAIELDPQNTQAQDLLNRLPGTSREAKRLKETGLLKLVEKHPDDPAACIALARLYLKKNALRKAETHLREAERRAPHDEQVKEMHVLTLLRSIDTNLKRAKFHLVKTDLGKVEVLNARKLAAHVAARHILLEMAHTGQLSLFDDGIQPRKKETLPAIIDRHTTPLSAAGQFAALGIMDIDRQQRPEIWNKARNKCLEQCFKSRRAAIGTLTSKAMHNLLLPDIDTLPAGFGQAAWLDIFVSRYKQIFEPLSDKDALPVMEALIKTHREDVCLKEIERRLKYASEPYLTLLRFYRMVVQHNIGSFRSTADDFSALIDGVPSQHKEMFRSAARRLSRSARGPLRAALEHFDFELLDSQCNCPICSGRADMNDFDEEIDDWTDDDYLDSLISEINHPDQVFASMVEAFVDTLDLRGASPRELKRRRKEMMNDYQSRTMLADMAKTIPPIVAMRLSDEARYLLFG
ncbi:hypothetical protein DSCO28_29730 [Desulfosarcina ovata subsp. sediminis]|uniref:Tetratricopeptide repeat protein n=1 Tax=Desulfosarcina ovata subsp. sediminis TaxID=885957 RepID=A0A5K7ZPC7_9BACT|nr:tetratricopeptide repeat protein [Desulfosarcina ovata]BBO82407.1 hypothetical protein DSCO28_29730 [Desulfosarcina ovata subsp. sediminis]